jgi:peptidylprolyl isomerase
VAVLQGAVPATSLVTADVVPGSGDEVAAGATVTVQYCGVGLASGAVFDSSWARGEPVSFPLSGVIKGWQDGIPGMQPGGRRVLVIPGADAYGPQPPPGSGIQPDETLVFVVDMISSP